MIEFTQKKSRNFSSNNLNEKYQIIYGRYLENLEIIFSMIRQKLNDKGNFVLVMSENATSSGEIISLIDLIVKIAASVGLELIEKFIDPIRKRSFSIKRNKMAPAMKNEYLLHFKKV